MKARFLPSQLKVSAFLLLKKLLVFHCKKGAARDWEKYFISAGKDERADLTNTWSENSCLSNRKPKILSTEIAACNREERVRFFFAFFFFLASPAARAGTMLTAPCPVAHRTWRSHMGATAWPWSFSWLLFWSQACLTSYMDNFPIYMHI